MVSAASPCKYWYRNPIILEKSCKKFSKNVNLNILFNDICVEPVVCEVIAKTVESRIARKPKKK